jgi:hypothetical protein
VFIVIQAALEKFLENKQGDSTWYVISYEILLNSLWSSLGYFWNSASSPQVVFLHGGASP